ncbi:MAG: ribose-phosphate pyrophosphokinase [Emcibacter sp.]|nr:ribose-phosphate pyrophosphokinase [Emcibacter sp.]
MHVVFCFSTFETIADTIAHEMKAERGALTIRHFPDGETFVKLETSVVDKDVIIVCSLDHPDEKIMALIFFSQTALKMGAKSVGLVAPYLGYMRQDKSFSEGEAVTADIFAHILSQNIDWLITVDPHLHRHKRLEEIYNIPCKVIHAGDLIAEWIKNNVKNPLLIGPDMESEQWVNDVAKKAAAPFIILQKIRHGDHEVEVSVPDVQHYQNLTPVLVDDIISTANTMIKTIEHLQVLKMKPPICIAVHAIFAEDSYLKLLNSGVQKVVSCNSITHMSNEIALDKTIAGSVCHFVKVQKPYGSN